MKSKKLNLDEWSELIDWGNLYRVYPDHNNAISILKEDYCSEQYDQVTGETIWPFSKWLKKEKVNLDEVLRMIGLKNQG